MGIEVQLAALIDAINQQTAAQRETNAIWEKLSAAAKNAANTADSGIKAAGLEVVPPKQTAQQDAPTPAASAPAQAAPAPAEPAAASPSDEVALTIKDLTEATTDAATRNREGLVALLKSYGVARAGALPTDKWAEFVAKAKAL